MRENTRIRERYELSLDGTQVASVVVGALVVLGAVFVLGLNVGKQLGGRARGDAPARTENPLAVLDHPATPVEPREKEPKLSFHDALTKGQPESAPIAEPKVVAPSTTGTALNALPPPAQPPTQAATPSPPPPPKTAASRPVAPTKKDAMSSAVAKASSLPGAAAAGHFAVQVGASQNEVEAQRIQKRFAAEGARVVVADLPGKGRWYRVKVGSYATRAEAERRLGALRSRGVQGFVTDAR